MKTVSESGLQANLRYYLRRVNASAAPLRITNQNTPTQNAVLLSEREYEGLMETIRVMRNPYLRAKIRRGQAQIQAEKTQQHALIDAGE